MKNCKLCGFRESCKGLPGICILAQYIAIFSVSGFLIYLFITQEILK